MARLDERPQDRLLLDNFSILGHAGRGGHFGDQLAQVRPAPNIVEFVELIKTISNGDQIGGFATFEELQNAPIDNLMSFPKEIIRLKGLQQLGNRRFGVQHGRPENDLFGLTIFRQRP
jgi:hypothetical protein